MELRLLAHFCGEETLARAFAEDRDVHAAVAAQIFKVKEDDVTKPQRAMAKTVNFGVLYGMSRGRALDPPVDPPQGSRGVHRPVLRAVSEGPRLPATTARQRPRQGEVGTLLGRKRTFNRNAINPRSHYKMRGQAEREAINMEIQGSAADLMKAMLAVHARLAAEKRESKILLTVHDELVFERPRRRWPRWPGSRARK